MSSETVTSIPRLRPSPPRPRSRRRLTKRLQQRAAARGYGEPPGDKGGARAHVPRLRRPRAPPGAEGREGGLSQEQYGRRPRPSAPQAAGAPPRGAGTCAELGRAGPSWAAVGAGKGRRPAPGWRPGASVRRVRLPARGFAARLRRGQLRAPGAPARGASPRARVFREARAQSPGRSSRRCPLRCLPAAAGDSTVRFSPRSPRAGRAPGPGAHPELRAQAGAAGAAERPRPRAGAGLAGRWGAGREVKAGNFFELDGRSAISCSSQCHLPGRQPSRSSFSKPAMWPR